jgi:hypothetical protein
VNKQQRDPQGNCDSARRLRSAFQRGHERRHRWTTGERGPIVDDSDLLAAADLTDFVTEAMHIGGDALSATGQARDSRALDQMFKDVGDKTADSTAKAVEATRRVVKDRSEVITNAADAAKKAFSEADTRTAPLELASSSTTSTFSTPNSKRACESQRIRQHFRRLASE